MTPRYRYACGILCAGCGGLSLGFQAAAFDLRAAVEFDPDAARSHGLNFHGGDPEHSQARDIITTRREDLAAELDLGPVADAVDVTGVALSLDCLDLNGIPSFAKNCKLSRTRGGLQ